MSEQIENSMTADGFWDESEYRVLSLSRLKREREAYEQAEREGNSEQYIV